MEVPNFGPSSPEPNHLMCCRFATTDHISLSLQREDVASKHASAAPIASRR